MLLSCFFFQVEILIYMSISSSQFVEPRLELPETNRVTSISTQRETLESVIFRMAWSLHVHLGGLRENYGGCLRALYQ